MTDKVQKIRAFLVGIADTDGVSTILASAIEKKILPYIDSLQEETDEIVDKYLYGKEPEMVDIDDLPKEEPVSEDLEEASKEWLSPQLDKSYAAYGETKQMELTHFDGYAMLDAIEFGAKWQKEKMMAKAVDGDITFDYYGDDDKTYGCIAHDSFCLEDFGLKDRDKVKVIITKED